MFFTIRDNQQLSDDKIISIGRDTAEQGKEKEEDYLERFSLLSEGTIKGARAIDGGKDKTNGVPAGGGTTA
ncbi:hypothetical protein ABTC22_19020, partial [Acinetobacter baumannii]